MGLKGLWINELSRCLVNRDTVFPCGLSVTSKSIVSFSDCRRRPKIGRSLLLRHGDLKTG